MLVLAIHTVATVSAQVPFAMIMLRYSGFATSVRVAYALTTACQCFNRAGCLLPDQASFVSTTPSRIGGASQGSRQEKRCFSWSTLQTGACDRRLRMSLARFTVLLIDV